MITDKVVLLKTHPCSRGLDESITQEIADACELQRYEPGEIVHRSQEIVQAIYLVVHGRLRVALLDLHGKELQPKFLGPGSQFGGLAVTTAEPVPLQCTAADPCTLLRLEYRRALDLTQRCELFRTNIARLIAEGVKQTLLPQRTPHMPNSVAVFHQSPETRIVSWRLYQRLAQLNDPLVILRDVDDWEEIPTVRSMRVDHLTPEETRNRVIGCVREGRRIFADASTSLAYERMLGVMETCEQVYWCVTPANWEASVPLLTKLVKLAPGWRDKLVIIWLLQEETCAPRAETLNQLAARDIKLSFRPNGKLESKALVNGFERLVHLVRGIQIGVALGGGAARGMAHLGVLKALEQRGIVVDQIAGTSAGAMTGTLYASGMGVDYAVERFVEDLRPSWLFRMLPRGDQWFLLYKYRRGQFDPMLRKYIGDRSIEQLPIPIKTITVDLISGQVVVRDQGDAVHGIVESINLPVLSPPIIRAGQALVDGGMINNVPADVLVASGCNFVIAVSVTGKMELVFASNRPETPLESMKPASTIQTILRTYLVQSTSINALGVQPADVVIEPDVTAFELTAFTRTDEMAAIGEQATREALPNIKHLLHQLDPQLFALDS